MVWISPNLSRTELYHSKNCFAWQSRANCDREQVIVVHSRICYDKGYAQLILPEIVGEV